MDTLCRTFFYFLIISSLLGCSQANSEDLTKTLANTFQDSHFHVVSLGYTPQPYFDADSYRLQISGETIQILIFSNPLGAFLATLSVSADGQVIAGQTINWTQSPHFYWRRQHIVIYVGENIEIIQIIESIMGLQFAGGVVYPDI